MIEPTVTERSESSCGVRLRLDQLRINFHQVCRSTHDTAQESLDEAFKKAAKHVGVSSVNEDIHDSVGVAQEAHWSAMKESLLRLPLSFFPFLGPGERTRRSLTPGVKSSP